MPTRLLPLAPIPSRIGRNSLDELQLTRDRGYAIDDLEFAADIRAIAAPIFDHTGAAIAGLAVAGPASRMSLESAHALAPAVVSMARRISVKLGYPDSHMNRR